MRLSFAETHAAYAPHENAPDAAILPVTLRGKQGRVINTSALLDSGADTSMFHAKWLPRIGIDLRTGRPGKIGGVVSGSELDGYYHRISMAIGGMPSIRCDVFFSEDMPDDYCEQLIGRDTIFQRMRFGLRFGAGLTYVGREH